MELEMKASSLRRLAEALREEEDGVKLRRDLAANLRKAVRPAVTAARAELMSMGSAGLPHHGESLRAFVAGQVVTSARLTGKDPGVSVRARSKGPRGFTNAARKLNREGGWRHPTFGRKDGPNDWHDQIGKPGWFDRPIRARREEYRAAVEAAMKAAAERIARKS